MKPFCFSMPMLMLHSMLANVGCLASLVPAAGRVQVSLYSTGKSITRVKATCSKAFCSHLSHLNDTNKILPADTPCSYN